TQLTMRTFHIGGTASRAVEESERKAKREGTIAYLNLRVVKNRDGEMVVLNRNGEVQLLDEREREIDRYLIPTGAVMAVVVGDKVDAGDRICTWDPHNVPILAETGGRIRYEDLIDGKTIKVEADSRRGNVRKQVIEHKGDLHPQLVLEDDKGQPIALYPIPERAYVEVDDGAKIQPGDLLAKTAREAAGTQDITGGLPRVTELFEARRPKDPAVISEIDGVV
ncbi:MAG: DNA-directed RNA polymerase subunit beta', partial [Planctomycetota bacterium]